MVRWNWIDSNHLFSCSRTKSSIRCTYGKKHRWTNSPLSSFLRGLLVPECRQNFWRSAAWCLLLSKSIRTPLWRKHCSKMECSTLCISCVSCGFSLSCSSWFQAKEFFVSTFLLWPWASSKAGSFPGKERSLRLVTYLSPKIFRISEMENKLSSEISLGKGQF